MIGLTISGLVGVQKMFEQLGKPDMYEDTVRQTGQLAGKYARQMCPVDTGAMRDSIYINYSKSGFELGASTPYAVFNEYGSIHTPIGSVQSPRAAKMTGYRPFLRPAMYRATGEMPEIFNKKLAQITTHG